MTATASFPALGTTATVAVTDPAALAPARIGLERELREIDLACSRFRSDSELARVNRQAGRSVGIGPRLTQALAVALRAAEATGGLVDPTIGASLRTLGYDRTFVLVRRREGGGLNAQISAVPGWHRVELDTERRTVRVPAGTELDLGATAKALAADRAADALVASLGCGVLVSLGGDVAVAGEPPADGWPVGIGDDHAGPTQMTVAIHAGGLASSSTTVRRWHAGAIELHHVLDPRTGAPASTPWRTATVAAASCVDANIASTAAIVSGADAPRWLEERCLPARLVSVGGASTYVGGWPKQQA